MIKSELIESVRERLGAVSSREVRAYVSFVFDAIAEALKDGDNVKITNFGVWSTRDKKARMGRNPRTRIEAEICARRVVRFRMSRALAEKFNPGSPNSSISDLDGELAPIGEDM